MNKYRVVVSFEVEAEDDTEAMQEAQDVVDCAADDMTIESVSLLKTVPIKML